MVLGLLFHTQSVPFTKRKRQGTELYDHLGKGEEGLLGAWGYEVDIEGVARGNAVE